MFCRQRNRMKIAGLFLTATVLFAIPALAGFKEDVARDLGTKSASLIAPAPTGAEWLIDADAGAGVQAGDLFSVIVKGAPIVHPTTKQTIGNLETVKAVLRVTKVKSGYSYAEIVGGKGDLKAGEEVRRFAGLPAIFWDYAGDGEAVFTQLQAALPDLDWQGYAAAQESKPAQPKPVPKMEPGLIFVFNDKGLGVKDQLFQPVRFYRPEQVTGKVAIAPAGVPTAISPAGASIVTPGSPTAAPTPGAIPGSSGAGWVPKVFGGGTSTPPGPGGALAGTGTATRGGLIMSQMDNRDGVWYGPRLEGKPVGVEVGDLDGDGKKEVALGFRDRLVVARIVAGKFEPVAEYPFGRSGGALSLDGLDLDGDGRMELYVTLSQDVNDLRSVGFELRENQLQQVVKQVPWFLRKVNLGGEGYVLLGQELNPDAKNTTQDLAGPVFRVSRSGDRLERGAAVNLPRVVSLDGFQTFESGGRPLVARLNINDKLQVMEPSGNVLWESSDYFGGSEVSFERFDGLQGSSNRHVFLSPRLEPGPDGTVLVPVNEGNRNFTAFRSFNSSHLKAVVYDGYSLVERWRTKPQGGYLGDFRMADADNDGVNEIVMLVMFSRGGLGFGSGSSALLIYEMQ